MEICSHISQKIKETLPGNSRVNRGERGTELGQGLGPRLTGMSQGKSPGNHRKFVMGKVNTGAGLSR